MSLPRSAERPDRGGIPHNFRLRGQASAEVIGMKERRADPKTTKERSGKEEKPVSQVYPVLDNDLARDNVENHIPAADLEDL